MTSDSIDHKTDYLAYNRLAPLAVKICLKAPIKIGGSFVTCDGPFFCSVVALQERSNNKG